MIATLLLLPAMLAAAAPPRFSAGVEQVRLDVAVSRRGTPVADLSADDFEVLDEGVRQSFELVSSDGRAVHGVLVLDLSSSLGPDERTALHAAAAAFLKQLETGDRATLLTFTENLQLVRGPAAPADVLASLSTLDARGTTALYDAVYAGLTLADVTLGRPFVLVFTDGIEQVSWTTSEKLVSLARALEATVYIVSPEPWSKPPARTERAVRRRLDTVGDRIPRPPAAPAAAGATPNPWAGAASREILDRIVADTGGRRFDAAAGRFAAEFTTVLAEVKNRYLLVYDAPRRARPGWHAVEVRLKRRKGDVRARRGYFAGGTVSAPAGAPEP